MPQERWRRIVWEKLKLQTGRRHLSRNINWQAFDNLKPEKENY
jgi:hypothetical protein